MSRSVVVRPADTSLHEALRCALLLAAIRLALQFACTLWSSHLGYSYFRDEFYYLACGHHLAWGYVDHGPIVALQARLGEMLFGTSVFGIRVFSAMAGAATIFLGGMIAWAMGGGRVAQVLAMIGLLLAPELIGTDGYLSMNSFEPVFWTFCALALVFVVQGRSAATWWTLFGVAAGVGLLNKPSMLFFLVALGIGLLLTPERRILFTRWAAVGIALAIVIALPNVLWQVHNHWPTLEFLRNGRAGGKNVVLSPLGFLGAQVAMMNPVTVFLWITGIVALVRAKSIRNARWLGFGAIAFFVIMYAMHAKDYYLTGVYPALFAAGAIAWETRFAKAGAGRGFAIPAYETLLVLTGLIVLPMSAPVLAPATWVRYTTALHLRPSNTETEKTGPLPQFYADRFGWDQLAAIVVKTYESLPPEERAHTCLWGTNYGEAGAMDFLGKKLDSALPAAFAPHNSYWMWGTHGCTFQTVIGVTGGTPAELAEYYDSVQVVGTLDNPWAMPFEHRNVYLLRHRKTSRPVNWEMWKIYF